MHLTQFTDFSLRVLIYAGIHDGRLVTIAEISRGYNISHNHLIKVVHKLGQLNYLETVRGKSGGIRLARPASEITLGQLVRDTEPHLDIAECFNRNENRCPITPACTLKMALFEARTAFLSVLDSKTLADMLDRRTEMGELLQRMQQVPTLE